MACHDKLLEALTVAAAWTKTTCIAEALRAQAAMSVNRKKMIFQDGLLNALADLAALEGLNDSDVRNCSIAALEQLTHEESTRQILSSHEGVMTALTKAAFASNNVLSDDAAELKFLTKSALKNLAGYM